MTSQKYQHADEPEDVLLDAYRYDSRPEVREKANALLHMYEEGFTLTEVAQEFNVTPTTITKWLKLFQQQGVDGLARKRHTTQAPISDASIHTALYQLLNQSYSEIPGWTISILRLFINDRMGTTYSEHSFADTLEAIGYITTKGTEDMGTIFHDSIHNEDNLQALVIALLGLPNVVTNDHVIWSGD